VSTLAAGANWPRSSIRALVDTDPTRGVLLVSWLAGFALVVDRMVQHVDRFPLGIAVLTSLLVGPPVGFALVFVEALLTTWTGRWLGGQGTFTELRAAHAWSLVPVLGFLAIASVRATDLTSAESMAPAVAGIVLMVCSQGLAILLVAEVHGVSLARGIGALLLAWLLRLVVLFALGAAVIATI